MGAGVVRLLQSAGAMVSRRQRGGLRAGWGRLWWCRGGVGGVRAGVAMSRWRRGRWTCNRVRVVGGGDVEWQRLRTRRACGKWGRVRRVEVAGIVVVTWSVGLRQGEGGCGRVEVASISGGRGGGVSRIAIGWGRVWRCRGGVMSGAAAGDRDGLHAREGR